MQVLAHTISNRCIAYLVALAVSERVGFPTSRAFRWPSGNSQRTKSRLSRQNCFCETHVFTFSFSSRVRRVSALRWFGGLRAGKPSRRGCESSRVMWHIHNARHRQTPNPKHKAPSNPLAQGLPRIYSIPHRSLCSLLRTNCKSQTPIVYGGVADGLIDNQVVYGRHITAPCGRNKRKTTMTTSWRNPSLPFAPWKRHTSQG
jgi:hypothetical protein